jgi:hypothetical protein
MKQVRLATLSLLIVLLCSLMSPGQQNVTTAANATVPPLIPFSNVATDEGGSSLSGVVQITFSLYNAQQGGEPLWTETQNNVQLDPAGHYSVQLGITKPNGVPTTLFTTGQARWLGVRIADQVEQPRVLMLSVPYALKAGDAATIGGLPPSAFVLAAPLTGAVSASGGEPVTGQGGPPPSGDVTGTGTVNYLPLWDSTSDITNSVVFQKGSGSTAKIGINTATPATTLDVKGGGTIRGTLSLPATGTATATAGKNSQPLNLAASAFNSTSSAAVNQTFQWQSEPAGNDTSTPSGTLNLLFGEGATKPSETGLNIASNGQITFATGQSFPGTGTITGISTATGSGLTGGGSSGTLNLGLLTTCTTKQVLQWSGSSWACATISGGGTITGVTAGTDLTGGGTSGNVTLNLDTTKVPQLGAANTFNANQTVFGTFTANAGGTAILGTSTSSTSPAIQGEGNGIGVLGVADSPSGSTVGVSGQVQSPSGYGVEGLSPGIAIIGQSSATSGGAGVDGTITSPTGYGVYGSNSAASGTAAGVHGTTASSTGNGVEGSSPYIGVYGTGIFGVKGASSNTGVWGTGNAGVIGTSSSTVNGGGVVGQATAITGNAPGVFGWTNSPSGYGVQGAVQASSGGTAGYFQVNTGSATILQGNNGSTTEFNVDAVGDVTAAGAVSGGSFQIAGQLFAFGSSVNSNAFLGFAGNTEMTGGANTASGVAALATNGAGGGNTASGFQALENNCVASAGTCSNNLGSYNTAAGYQALIYNTTGSANTGTGSGAGRISDNSYLTGDYNTALGYNAGFSTGSLNNATAIGANAIVSESNALVLGSGANVGIGTSAPGHLLDVAGFVAFDSTGQNNGNGIDLTFGVDAGEGISSSRTAGPNQYGLDLYTDYNRRISIEQHGNVGIGTTSPDSLLTVNGSADKPGGGSWGTFSDGRLKTVNGGFTPGLSQVMKIHPVHYRYKADNAMGIRDTDEHIGVVAQDVQKVIPEAVTENSKGYLLVNNDPIIWTMLNAIKEQQGEFRQQQTELAKALLQIKQQQKVLRAQSAAMRGLQAEVRETRESLRKVKAQIVAAKPSLIAAK